MRRGAWIGVVVALLLISCGDDDPYRPELQPPPLQATSPGEVTDLLITALEEESIERYDSLLTRDYTFIFSPLDALSDTIPDSWDLTDELRALTGLFADSMIEGITVEWTPDEPLPPDFSSADLKVILRNVFIEVAVRLPSELLLLQVNGDMWLHLRKEPWTAAEGDSVWKVVWWEDKTQIFAMSPTLTQQVTWGRVKARYR